MYSENYIKDIVLFLKALASNQIARFSPSSYVRLTHQTGRGNEKESAIESAHYFFDCVNDYLSKLGIDKEDCQDFLKDKKILEYGPGDTLGVALLMYAYGAESVECIDRFPLSTDSKKSSEIYLELINRLEKKYLERASSAFIEKGNPSSGFKPELISYSVQSNGLSGAVQEYDLILSRAVLEHVNNLEGTILDIEQALKKGGISIHQVDLKSHGLDRYRDFDFLSWPQYLYKLMYSHKGFPNRWRVNKYLQLVEKSELKLVSITATGKLETKCINAIKDKLTSQFRSISTEELSWLGFWIILKKT